MLKETKKMTQTKNDVVDVLDPEDDIVSRIGKVPVKEIVIDRRVQRGQLNKAKLNTMVLHFDRHALGTVVLSERPNGTYIALDGWHRVEACKLAPTAPAVIDAKIFSGLTVEQEAKYFRLYNARTSMHILDKFRVEAVEGIEKAVKITEIVEDYGLVIESHSFAAVGAATRIVEYPNGYDLLNRTLSVIDAAWACVRGSLDHRIVEGIAVFLNYYDNRVTAQALADKLRKKGNNTPAEILETALAYNAAKKGPVKLAVVDVLTRIYNVSARPGHKLPDYARHVPNPGHHLTIHEVAEIEAG
jgi:hypothetical protein